MSHPFYQALGQTLKMEAFDTFVEQACQKFYAEKNVRPRIPPSVYFRSLLIGYLEGISIHLLAKSLTALYTIEENYTELPATKNVAHQLD